MSSSSTSSSKAPQNSLKLDEQTRDQQPTQPQLSGLEEDDEFEEFAVQDWDDSETDLTKLGNAGSADVKSGADNLWEDNWDDDDVEDEFSVQLRNELAKTGQGTTGVTGGRTAAGDAEPMQH